MTKNHWILLIAPMILLLASAGWVELHWSQIPERFPIHWGLNGEPNGWSDRSLLGVYKVHLIGAGILAWILLISSIQNRAKQPLARKGTAEVLIGAAWLIGIMFSIIGLMPLWIGSSSTLPYRPVWLVLPVAVIIVSIALALRSIRSEATAGDGQNWRGGVFYYNPDDPSLWVPKRLGIGYTINFAHRLAWLFVVLILALPVVTLLLIRASGHS